VTQQDTVLHRDTLIELVSDGVSFQVDVSSGTPAVVYWGPDLGRSTRSEDLAAMTQDGVPQSNIDEPQVPGVWRENARGFLGRPAVLGHRDGQDWSQLFTITNLESSATSLVVESVDTMAGLSVSVSFQMQPAGVVLISQTVTNVGVESFDLSELTTWLPLFDELKRRHPGLEIESCSSGGGRVDLGMAAHADRFWTSDCNDALERQYIQRYTQFAIPPELLGSHIGPTRSHTTGRVHSLAFRAITALFGHAGIEWDITDTTGEERLELASWAAYYKRKRGLLHSGRTVRVEQPDETSFVHGVIAHDRSEAIFAYVQLAAAGGSSASRFLLPGLDPDALYRVRLAEPAGAAHTLQAQSPPWTAGIEASGLALAQIGLRPPILMPENAILIELERL